MSRVTKVNSNGLRSKSQKHSFRITALLVGLLLLGFASSTIAGGFSDITSRGSIRKDSAKRASRSNIQNRLREENQLKEEFRSLCGEIKRDYNDAKSVIRKIEESQSDQSAVNLSKSNAYIGLYMFLRKYDSLDAPEDPSGKTQQESNPEQVIKHGKQMMMSGSRMSSVPKETRKIPNTLYGKLMTLREKISSSGNTPYKTKSGETQYKNKNQKIINIIDQTIKQLSQTISLSQKKYNEIQSELLKSKNHIDDLKNICLSDSAKLIQKIDKLIKKYNYYVDKHNELFKGIDKGSHEMYLSTRLGDGRRATRIIETESIEERNRRIQNNKAIEKKADPLKKGIAALKNDIQQKKKQVQYITELLGIFGIENEIVTK